MNNVHILMHRWFADGEGWAYDSNLPKDLRTKAEDEIILQIKKYDGSKVIEEELRIGKRYLFVHIENDKDCRDIEGKRRGAHIDIGIISDQELSFTQKQKYLSIARTIQQRGTFSLESDVELKSAPEKQSCKWIFKLLAVCFIVLLCVYIGSYYFGMDASQETTAIKELPPEAPSEPKIPDNEIPAEDDTQPEVLVNEPDAPEEISEESVPSAQPEQNPEQTEEDKNQEQYEKLKSELDLLPETAYNKRLEKLQEMLNVCPADQQSKLEKSISECQRYITFEEAYKTLTSGELDLIEADKFIKKPFPEQDYLEANGRFSELKDRIKKQETKLTRELEEQLNQYRKCELYEFKKQREQADQKSALYQKFADKFPEGSEKRKLYQEESQNQKDIAEKLSNPVYDNFEKDYRETVIKRGLEPELRMSKAQNMEESYKSEDMPLVAKELFDSIKRTIENCQHDIDNKAIYLSDISETETLNKIGLGDITKFIKQVNIAVELRKSIKEYVRKNQLNEKNLAPDAKFILDNFPDINIDSFTSTFSIPQKEYNEKITSIKKALSIESFDEIENKLDFQRFFVNSYSPPNSKGDFVALNEELQKQILESIGYFCCKSQDSNSIATAKELYDYINKENNRFRCPFSRINCEMYPWYVIWYFSYQYLDGIFTPKELVENSFTEREFIKQITNKAQQKNSRFAKFQFSSEKFADVLNEFFDCKEVFDRKRRQPEN